MARKAPLPQDTAVQLNLSVPLRVKDAVREAAEKDGKSASRWATALFKKELGMQ